VTQEIQIADGIQHLMLDELIFVTQTVVIEYPVFIKHDGIIEPAAARQSRRTQRFEITMKPKVRARLTSLTKEVVEKSTLAFWVELRKVG